MALFSKKDNKKAKASKEVEVSHEHNVEATGSSAPVVEDANAFRFITSPHVTEKASNGAMYNQYTFKVPGYSNKIEIKKAVEKLYKVQVSKVNVRNMPSKTRQVGRHSGTKSGFKKATIVLKDGYKIETV